MRRRIGMVFQKPNPFPKTIYDNIAYGPRILGMKGDMDEIVETALRGAALWDEVKDRLERERVRDVRRPAAAPLHRALHGRQPGRDLDGRAVLGAGPDRHRQDRRSDAELKENYTIIIVTHNMQQAARVSDMTAFLIVELDSAEKNRWGRIIEYDETEKIFTNPADKRTEDYVTGKVG